MENNPYNEYKRKNQMASDLFSNDDIKTKYKDLYQSKNYYNNNNLIKEESQNNNTNN